MKTLLKNSFSKIVFVGVLYFLSAWLGFSFTYLHQSVSPVWPPTGIAFAALWLLGSEVWIGIFLGALLSNTLLAEGGVLVSFVIACGNTLEALVGVYMVKTYASTAPIFQKRRDLFTFLLWAGAVAPAISATIGTLALAIAGKALWTTYGSLWITWWLGDSAGNLIVVPLILAWANVQRHQLEKRRVLEALACLSLLMFVSGSRYGWFFQVTSIPPQSLLLVPVLVWAGLRLEGLGTATAMALLAVVATYGTIRGDGPFGGYSKDFSLLLLQIFLASLTVTIQTLTTVVTELKSLDRAARLSNEKLRASEEELRRSNQELEQFAYIASHDLQEPLRVVTIYAELLKERFGKALPGEATPLVEGLAEESKRMSHLVKDLLTFSKAGANQTPQDEVSGEQALEAALKNLKLVIEENHASVSFSALPKMQGNFAQVVQLFQNLLSNAIKYRSEATPNIHVEAKREKAEWIFSVQDNGIGFDTRYARKIFRPFQRLHNRKEYPGTGIGLATCSKIVERHGGRIWAKSKEGEGSTFFFSIPAMLPGEMSEANA